MSKRLYECGGCGAVLPSLFVVGNGAWPNVCEPCKIRMYLDGKETYADDINEWFADARKRRGLAHA